MKISDELREKLNFSILNLDKPAGPTSFTISEYVMKRLREFGIKKTSHFGTLDPKVTGVLPIALGRACRLTGYFLGHDKVYLGILHTHSEQDIKELQKIIGENFVGKIKQTPPVRSSVKRAERIREVYRWELLEVSDDKKNFLFVAEVEGGTYIRKLCSDLGEMIGGGHMDELRRTRAGVFSEKDKEFADLYDFKEAMDELEKGNEEKLNSLLVPAEDAIKKIMPFVKVDKNALNNLMTGKPVLEKSLEKGEGEKLPKVGEVFAVFSGKKFVEIAEAVKNQKYQGNDVVGKAKFVLN